MLALTVEFYAYVIFLPHLCFSLLDKSANIFVDYYIFSVRRRALCVYFDGRACVLRHILVCYSVDASVDIFNAFVIFSERRGALCV